jgi:hypothetical protein
LEETAAMKNDWKYILYISLAVALFVSVKLLSPKQHNWAMTFAQEDKNPYGAYALNKLLPDIFSASQIIHSYKTLYEIKDSLNKTDNILIVTANFNAGKEDTHALLKHLENGGSAFISAQYFGDYFHDTLKISTTDYFFQNGAGYDSRDTSYLKTVNAMLDTVQEFKYRRDNIHNYFDRFDTTKTTIIAKNDFNYPVTIRMQIGKGTLILNSTPLIFTNIYLLSENNHEFISKSLSYLPNERINWTEYYHLGRMEVSTPLRFVLSNEPLRWAYYIAVISLLIFMVFEMKRKQRIIPVIEPISNTTLQFVSTIGNLYYHRGDHKNIAEKRISFFLEELRSKHGLNTSELDDEFVKKLSRKFNSDEEHGRRLVRLINFIKSTNNLTEEKLIQLNTDLEKFRQAI